MENATVDLQPSILGSEQQDFNAPWQYQKQEATQQENDGCEVHAPDSEQPIKGWRGPHNKEKQSYRT